MPYTSLAILAEDPKVGELLTPEMLFRKAILDWCRNARLTIDNIETYLLNFSGGGVNFNVEDLTYAATMYLDFSGEKFQRVALTGAVTFGASVNKAAAGFISVKIDANGANRAITFNASWKWIGDNFSTGDTLLNGNFGVLSLTCYGTAETDIFAVWVVSEY